MNTILVKKVISIVLVILLTGCSTTNFDIRKEGGVPTLKIIVDRIECELVSMIKHDDFSRYGFKQLLVGGDYVVAMNLSFETEDIGALTPSLSFPAVGSNLAIGAGFNLTRTQTDTFTRKMRYSFKELHARWKRSLKTNAEFGQCPTVNGRDLEGELGIKQKVALQFSAPSTPTSLPGGNKDEFAGSIEFVFLRNINSAGPTWTLSNFVGPGGLLRLQRTSESKLDFAFATGSLPSDRSATRTATDIFAADDFLNQSIILQQE